MILDFTLAKYALLCEVIRELRCPTMTVREFLQADQPDAFLVLLRHDVDRHLTSALRMADLEAQYGMAATYYIRMTSRVFKPRALKSLAYLGHEVGYHYEVLARSRGYVPEAIRLFDEELARMRRVVPVETISMHSSPMSSWNNRLLWIDHDFRDRGVIGEVYISIGYKSVFYLTDTGRSWHSARYNLRDCVDSLHPVPELHTTDDLIDFLQRLPDHPVMINVHPNRWANGPLSWGLSFASDCVINWAKLAIGLYRGARNHMGGAE